MIESTVPALAVVGATILDAVSDKPLEGHTLLAEGGRIRAIARPGEIALPTGTRVIDASGKFLIPGLMNANVHLFGLHPVEGYSRYLDRYEDLILESAQVALQNGLTTVFDTWGPRRALMAVRDRINQGAEVGSRIFCAGNIVGFDGPFSADFLARAPEVVSAAFARRINAQFVENVGRHLMWLTPEKVAQEVSQYLGRGTDFVKYASNDHYPGAFLAFSPAVQAAIVEAAHRANTTAQAHSMSVEGLRIAIEAGCDLVTHCNITGPTPIPQSTLDLMERHGTGAVIFPFTQKRFAWILENVSETERVLWQSSDVNARNLIGAGVRLLLANDGTMCSPDWLTDPQWGNTWITGPGEDNLCRLDTGHFSWFKAMEEKGCRPLDLLRAATRNIALAYGKDNDLGTVETGKIADLVILDGNPLQCSENYRRIAFVIKEGQVIDRGALPSKPLVTRGVPAAMPEEAAYIPFITGERLPLCPTCLGR